MEMLMESFWGINSTINGIVWGWPMVIALASTGVVLSVGLKFLPWRDIGLALKITFGKGSGENADGISPRAALFTALSATVGTGNIAGVASAIYVGGPGAIFYMWLIALFGMATKYAEAVLAVEYREKNDDGDHIGGPMYYIRNGLKDKMPALAKPLAMAFAVFAALAAFGIGNGVQVNSIAGALKDTFGVAEVITGGVTMVLVGLVIFGGIRRIADVAEKLVPTMIVIYLGLGIVVLFTFAENIPAAFGSIFHGAFNADAAVGGAIGATILQGFKRGIFSNEAGLGSAAIAHAAAHTDNPVRQGMIGMVGVFIDTLIVCTFTALIILVSGIYEPGNGINGAVLTTSSFGAALPGFGAAAASLALAVFAFTTILGWAYYGERSFEYITKNKTALLAYRGLYVLVVFVAASIPLDKIWGIADTLNGLMALPNLIGLLLLAPVIFGLTKKYRSKV